MLINWRIIIVCVSVFGLILHKPYKTKDANYTIFFIKCLKYSVVLIRNINKFTDVERRKHLKKRSCSRASDILFLVFWRTGPPSEISALNILDSLID